MPKRTLLDNLADSIAACHRENPQLPRIFLRYKIFATDAGAVNEVQAAIRKGYFVTMRKSQDGSLQNLSANPIWNWSITGARTIKGVAKFRLSNSADSKIGTWDTPWKDEVLIISERPGPDQPGETILRFGGTLV